MSLHSLSDVNTNTSLTQCNLLPNNENSDDPSLCKTKYNEKYSNKPTLILLVYGSLRQFKLNVIKSNFARKT